MYVSPIGYQPVVASNNHIRFQSNPITSGTAKDTDLRNNTLPAAWSAEYQNIDIKTTEEMYKKTAEILNKQYAEIKKTAFAKLEKALPAEKRDLIELIEELPLIEEAKIKRLKLYLEAEKKKNKTCNEAHQKKIEIYKEAEEKKDQICEEAEKKREKEYRKAEEVKDKAFKEAESKRRGIYLIAKRRYDLKIISETEFNEILSSAQKQCEKSKSDAFKRYEETKISAYRNCENTESAAYRDCENTETAAYRECKNTMYKAFSDCDISKLTADVEYKNALNLHEKLMETLGEDVYKIIIEQKKSVKLAEQKRDGILAEYADFYNRKSGKSCSNITTTQGNKMLNNEPAVNLNFVC